MLGRSQERPNTTIRFLLDSQFDGDFGVLAREDAPCHAELMHPRVEHGDGVIARVGGANVLGGGGGIRARGFDPRIERGEQLGEFFLGIAPLRVFSVGELNAPHRDFRPKVLY